MRLWRVSLYTAAQPKRRKALCHNFFAVADTADKAKALAIAYHRTIPIRATAESWGLVGNAGLNLVDPVQPDHTSLPDAALITAAEAEIRLQDEEG